jgi:hypothetical protein
MHAEGHAPGRIALLGSGETSLAGGRVFESLARVLPTPLQVAVLETPAGFEVNSDRVAGRVADFLALRLQNYRPEVSVVAARQHNTPFSPDDPEITAPLLGADLIFMGPGSPTYAVRQLADSLAWHRLIARHRVGATLAFASAAVISISANALPVYEIYKAGHDLHWEPGLDLFGAYGLKLVFVPHWNNAEGGADLDTSHCFMGRYRFEVLRAMLPPDVTVVGIDEHTALAIDLADGAAEVMGAGDVTVLRGHEARSFAPGGRFSLAEFGPFAWPQPDAGLPAEVWAEVLAAHETSAHPGEPPVEVMALVAQREAARTQRDWALADRLRQQVAALGWLIRDTATGPGVEAMPGDKTRIDTD